MLCTIQVSNHPEAGKRIPTKAASESWKTVYDGEIATTKEAENAVDKLADWYRHVRLFKAAYTKSNHQDKTLGKLAYAVLRMG